MNQTLQRHYCSPATCKLLSESDRFLLVSFKYVSFHGISFAGVEVRGCYRREDIATLNHPQTMAEATQKPDEKFDNDHIPATQDEFLVDWDEQDVDPQNWPASKKTINVALLSSLTFVT